MARKAKAKKEVVEEVVVPEPIPQQQESPTDYQNDYEEEVEDEEYYEEDEDEEEEDRGFYHTPKVIYAENPVTAFFNKVISWFMWVVKVLVGCVAGIGCLLFGTFLCLVPLMILELVSVYFLRLLGVHL